MSPSTATEDERRELIARQRSALYGDGQFSESGSRGYVDENGISRPGTGTQSVVGRGHSPLAFSNQTQNDASSEQTDGQPTHVRSPSRANSTSSPSSNTPGNFALFESTAQQSSRTSTTSPGSSPPHQVTNGSNGKANNSSVAPIGTRPSNASGAQAVNPALNKRSTTPLPSPLSFGFAAGEQEGKGDRKVSASSNSAAAGQQEQGLGWGSKSAVWGTKGGLGVQASVWG